MKTFIYLTTQTSATDSMLRIFSKIYKCDFNSSKYIDLFLKDNKREDLKNEALPNDGGLHRFNLPPLFDHTKVQGSHRLIINYRDPRDHFCNIYHWQFNHPVPGETEQERECRIKKLDEISIDEYVLQNANPNYYKNIVLALKNLSQEKYTVLSYARLCLDFDSFLKKSSDFLQVPLTDEVITSLENERTDNLVDNPKYIGNKWGGADTGPGRYKRELKPETIKELTKKFRTILDVMAEHDKDFSEYYK